MTDDEVFAERLSDAVRAHPGLTRYRLARLLQVDEHQLEQVISRLTDEGRVSGRTQRASVRWYAPEVPADQEPPTGVIRPGMRAYEALVLASARPGGITPGEVATRTGMSTGYAYKVMLRLEGERLVKRCGEERRWVVSRQGHDLMRSEADHWRSQAPRNCIHADARVESVDKKVVPGAPGVRLLPVDSRHD